MTRKLVCLVMTLALLVISLIGCTAPAAEEPAAVPSDDASAAGDNIKILCFTSLTGANAEGGRMDSQAAALAVDHVNAAGGVLGGRQLELVVVDATSDTTQAPLVLESALSKDDITGVIGSNTSSITLTQLPILEKYKVPCIVGSVNAKITGSGYNYIIRPGCTGGQMAEANVDLLLYMVEASGKNVEEYKVGIIYENSAYGMDTAAGYKEYCDQAGLNVIVEESYPAATLTDASAIVTKLKQAGVDLVMAVSLTEDAKLIINTMKAMNYAPVLFGGGEGFIWPPLEAELGDSVNGIISAAVWNLDQTNNLKADPEWDKVNAEYKERYGDFLAEQGGEMYTFIRMYAEAIDRCNSDDREEITKALKSMNTDDWTWLNCVPNVDGIKINETTGQGEGSLAVMIQWQNNVPCTVWPREISNVKVIDMAGNAIG